MRKAFNWHCPQNTLPLLKHRCSPHVFCRRAMIRNRKGTRTIGALLYLYLALTPLVFSQQQNAASIMKAPPRDPNALDILQSSLTVMGGADAWTSVKSARRQGQYTKSDSEVASAFTWTDDWSRGIPKFRRDSSASGTSHAYIQESPQTPGYVSSQSKYSPPPLDLVDSIITQLPAVAILRVITDASYGLSIYPSPAPSTAKDCVLVTRFAQPPVKALWCFSPQKHLPSFAILSMANVAHPSVLLSKKITYLNFAEYRGLTMPAVSEIAYPWGGVVSYSFTGFEANPELPSTTFSKGQP